MSTVPPNPEPPQFERDVALIFEALQLLRTRDGLAVTDDQLAERSRNAVASLRGEYIVCRTGTPEFGEALAHLDAASEILTRMEARRA